ncbi:hypothetical protein D3C73_1143460 [compost metagenome]
MEWYELLISQSFQLGYQALTDQDAQLKEQYFNTGLKAYQHVLDGVEHLKTLPEGQLQGNPFEITQNMILSAGKMQYMLGKHDESVNIFQQGIREDLNDATNREIARWYLVSLQKTGNNDQDLYNKLVSIDPSEERSIEQLVEQNF